MQSYVQSQGLNSRGSLINLALELGNENRLRKDKSKYND